MRSMLAVTAVSTMHKGGDIAQQMAATPLVTPAKPKVNRFAAWFGPASFKAEPMRKAYEFKNGQDAVETLQFGKASILFSNIPGVHFTAARIVLRVAPGPADKEGNMKGTGKKTLSLVMPSIAIGPVRHPIISLKEADEATQREYLDFQSGVLTEYMAWRKAEVASGHIDKTQTAVASNAREVSGDDIEALGL